MGEEPMARRPQTPHMSQSFTRLEPKQSSPHTRNRASTLQSNFVPRSDTPEMFALPLPEDSKIHETDIFEKDNMLNGAEGLMKNENKTDVTEDVPKGFDDLPIELISLIDR